MKWPLKGVLLVGIFILCGCSQKLSEEKNSFSDKGVAFTIQLPQSWQKSSSPEHEFNAEAVFGAEDEKSNSNLYLLTQSKENVDLKDLGKRTREEIRQRYGFETAENVVMETIKVNDFPAHKYTIGIIRERKKVLLYFYYIETKSSLVQGIVYSAIDGNEEDREKLIDQAMSSLKETGADDSQDSKADEQIIIQNEQLSFEITGLLKLENEGKPVLAIRYTTKNLNTESLTPAYWSQVVQAAQGEAELIQVANLSEANRLDLIELLENQNQAVVEGSSLESAVIYELKDEQNINLIINQAFFPHQKEISLVIPYAGQERKINE